MDVKLNPNLAKFVRDKVRSGQYPDADHVINSALNELQQREAGEEFTPEHRAYLRRELQRGVEQADRGEFAEFTAEDVIAEARRQRAEAERG